jgi:adenine-specific DNA-methyltransferase
MIDGIKKNLINRAWDIVDKEILINGIGIEEKLCIDARAICKKLQRRRLKRS